MSTSYIRLATSAEKIRVPEDLKGLQRALEDALHRIEVLEDEVRRLRGEAPLRDDAEDDA